MKLGKCVQTGETMGDVTPHIMLDEYPNNVLKISTVFSKGLLGCNENSILLKRDSVRMLVTMLQEWLGEPLAMNVKLKAKRPR